MHQFQRIRVLLVKIDTGNTGVVHLYEEFLQVCPALVIFPGILKKATGISTFKNTDAEVDVLAEAHL